MKRIDFNKNGGYPLTQDTANYLQTAYTEALGAIGLTFGNKVIVSGCTISGSNISDGWIVINGEVIKFVGGTVNTKVKITETGTSLTFKNGISNQVLFNKTAACTTIGDFDFSELVRASAFNEIVKAKYDGYWLTGDVKMVNCNNAYINTNFDNSGLGRLERLGWAICNGQNGTADMRGRFAVGFDVNTIDPNDNVWDVIYNTMGSTGGEKKHQLTVAEIPPHKHFVAIDNNADGTVNNTTSIYKSKDNGQSNGYILGGGTASPTVGLSSETGGNQLHENRPPFIVTLFIQKI
jgi:microcystin-dependent protein